MWQKLYRPTYKLCLILGPFKSQFESTCIYDFLRGCMPPCLEKKNAFCNLKMLNLNHTVGSGVTGGGQGGRVPPQRLLTGKFLLTYREKRGKEKRERGENWVEKVENWKWKQENVRKRGEDLFFFFFCFSLLKTTKICFGSTKMGIFYREKAFHAGKKIRKNDFAPSEKYACYAPDSRPTYTLGL